MLNMNTSANIYDDNISELDELKTQTLDDIDQAVRIIKSSDAVKWNEYLLLIMWIPIEEIITCYVWMGKHSWEKLPLFSFQRL